MEIDLELYRREVRVSYNPTVHLSVIDIAPGFPVHTLMFLHGFGGEARQWGYQLREFSTNNRVIALDMRGHGLSDRPSNGYTMGRIVDDVIGTLDVLGVAGKVTLIGHSFGGAVATELAVRYAEKVEHLILISTAGEFHLNPAYRTALALPPQILGRLTRFTSGWLGAPPALLRSWYRQNLRSWAGWKLFEQVSVPTLVIRGHMDRVFDKEYFDGVAQIIPEADEVNVGYSGHMVMIERRDAVNREIDRFINRTPRTWRYEPADNPQITLFANRPWLYQYEREVPYTVAIPPVALNELLNSAARRFPQRTALEYQGETHTYQRLLRAARSFAAALQQLEFQPGDRVFLDLPNLPALVAAYFGTLLAGGVVVFPHPDSTLEELQVQIQETGSKVILTLDRPQEKHQLLHNLPEVQRLILVDPQPSGWMRKWLPAFLRRKPDPVAQQELLDSGTELSFRQLLRTFAPEPQPVEINPRDLAVISYTGGTIGRPKGVMLSHRNLVSNAIQVRHWMPEAKEGQEVFLSVLPLTHSYGFTTALNVPIALAATLILRPRFDMQNILTTIRKLKPTIFPGVPGMYVAMINTPDVRNSGVGSIKYCLSGSAPLPVEVKEGFERLTKGRLVEGYGLTEASPVTHVNPLGGSTRVGSIGLPLPSTEARLVDLQKGERAVAVGQIGELAIRGPQVMLGYWKDPEASSQVLQNGWLLTGDVAQMDPNGYFHLISRKADMWFPRKLGDPAFPRDVEEVIYEIPQVEEAVVVAIAGQPIAFVKLRNDQLDVEAVISYCKRRLPPDLVPRLVIFVEDFPRTFIGKVLRRQLANEYSAEREISEPRR